MQGGRLRSPIGTDHGFRPFSTGAIPEIYDAVNVFRHAVHLYRNSFLFLPLRPTQRLRPPRHAQTIRVPP